MGTSSGRRGDQYLPAGKGTNNANTRIKRLKFKNNAPFRSCISKINSTFIDSAQDLDTVMPMYNLLEYSDVCVVKYSEV